MGAMTNPSDRIARFSRAERWLHRCVAGLMFVLLGTAAALYIPDISVLVGNRPLMRDLHIIAGIALPASIALALFASAVRSDFGQLNRFTPADWQWLRSPDRRSGRIPVGKFNAGQKLNAAFTLGAILVMFVTGMIMWQNGPFPDDIRTGATFVHDWLTLPIVIVLAGHIWMAMGDLEARRGMRTGSVSARWARTHHGQWFDDEQTQPKTVND
jgi:formate dehydrogenase subunit gamma